MFLAVFPHLHSSRVLWLLRKGEDGYEAGSLQSVLESDESSSHFLLQLQGFFFFWLHCAACGILVP